ncbi:SDR family oxidoreductase [Aldersonia sp. NBC_00410]|uniref:SDR family oxidoreductase n=1 Tax=Aldersonia sp. NBC_00410 TaxID=2975954 RepID=UPI0022507E6C|nr:SDR family oxidoreductase [Aldersonia sp. NBC_00410]MCX5044095.1 SDR family oxidoreductase [Aldersonia sp. NBC_00410]
MTPSVSLAGKVVVVTGGARGIGLAIATAMHDLGAKVAIGDIDESAVEEAGSRSGFGIHCGLDVTSRQSFVDFLDAVEDRLGPIDVLVNNAGIVAVGPAIDEPDAVTQRVLDVNVHGMMLGTKLAAKRMIPRGRGHIINIASAGAIMPVPGIASYSATKFAVLGFTDAVRLENRGSGVHFSVVLPSLTNTEMIAGVGRARGFQNLEPEDVAKAVVGLIAKPRPRVVVPRSFGVVALSARRFMPQRVAEAVERALGAEHVFLDDVEFQKRQDYANRTGTS